MRSKEILVQTANLMVNTATVGILIKNGTVAMCLRCAPRCLECDESNFQVCSKCINGSFLSGTSCLACNQSCSTCSVNATNCLVCPPGQLFSTVLRICANCTVTNCQNCSTLAVCAVCRPGFVVTSTGTCRQCSTACSRCNASKITQCLGCEKGSQLVG